MVGVRISPALTARIDARAKATGETRSGLIRRYIELGLEAETH
jgi:predicted DNA-binding protein